MKEICIIAQSGTSWGGQHSTFLQLHVSCPTTIWSPCSGLSWFPHQVSGYGLLIGFAMVTIVTCGSVGGIYCCLLAREKVQKQVLSISRTHHLNHQPCTTAYIICMLARLAASLQSKATLAPLISTAPVSRSPNKQYTSLVETYAKKKPMRLICSR